MLLVSSIMIEIVLNDIFLTQERIQKKRLQ